jgi:peptide deformylase
MKFSFRVLGYITGALVAGFLIYMLCGQCPCFSSMGFADCSRHSNLKASGFTSYELSVINESDSIMRVLTIDDPRDLAVLRAQSSDFSSMALLSEEFERLSELMVATVTHPSQDGVGIAGPQVGLNRRVVAVQRFDKEGEPFEVYPNVRIVWQSDSLAFGPEGCLSVPDRREDVARSQEIVIEYTAVPGLKTIRDTISGFTAVIFQHEVDHLDGVLYIDRVAE